ncbi:MAG: hypothetical protein JST30_12480 [Armatimonadetes bacterium]|nr:hypothetical protein [Armatimonadota bacterium]
MGFRLRTGTLILLTAFAVSSFAQDDPKPSPESDAYHAYRHQLTQPLYGTAKVKSLIAKIKTDREDNRVMPDSVYKKLTFQEKLTFVLLHGEDFSQNCDMMPRILDEQKKIFPYFPSPFGDESVWSERQRGFLTANRAKVVALLRETIRTRKRVGVNVKAVIATLDAKELVPDVVKVYKADRKDRDILTLLMVLMGASKYGPFLKTGLYRDLYGEEAGYQANVPFDAKTEAQILTLATAFAKSGR